ncbi:hypothetical protein BCR33DRAFT_845882 [Rhizoclosmatium globosum]|uniref:Galactose oxidase n=1 Tax=Rhizoclosmatium globosum TaxID=329046 RepID=A0A1Y2CXW2_9FUNG|nr:hypothetical protein BCR33DRAFT_845882 [Rhizoclosmatium globosum]|eukprot:ORY51879.1 hypothetical protein BCR33DRAFT_845882 [Rhizoclosmatium globosum]
MRAALVLSLAAAAAFAQTTTTTTAAGAGAGAGAGAATTTSRLAVAGLSSSASAVPTGPTPISNAIPNSGLAIGSILTTKNPVPRFGASAQWIHDQGVVLFVGGWGGSWNAQTTLPANQSVAALSLRNVGFNTRSAIWLDVPTPQIVDLPAGAVNPLDTSYAVSAVARSVDVNMPGPNVDVLYYLFGNSANPSTSAVYQYIPSNARTMQTYDNHIQTASPRVRSASCLLDPSTMIIHGGADGPDGGTQTQTIQGTYFLSLLNATTTNNAWVSKSGSGADPLLHDHSMACVAGIAYMLGGITGEYRTDGSMVMASTQYMFVYTYSDQISAGSWKNVSLSPDPDNGYPLPRRSATLTPADPSSNILLYHGGVHADLSITYGDLWQLDTSTLTWKQLPSSPQVRHSHNAVAVNGYLITAFGVISNATDPAPPVPVLLAYDINRGTWGDMPTVPYGAPPPLPSHTPPAPTATAIPESKPTLSTPVIGGIAGGAAALVLIIVLVCFIRKRKQVKDERMALEQKIVDRLHREDMDHTLALQGIRGITVHTPVGREVGGELAKVIRQNQTGIRSVSYDDGGARGDDSVYEETDSSSIVVAVSGPDGQVQYKYVDGAMKIGLNDERVTSPLVAHGLNPAMRASYASGLSGLTYPSGSGVSEEDESSVEGGSEASDAHADAAVTRSVGTKDGDETTEATNKRASVAQFIDTVRSTSRNTVEMVRSSSRNAAFPRDEPMRPWELPGMGIKSTPTVKNAAVGGRSSPLVGGARPTSVSRSYSPLIQNDANRSRSRSSYTSPPSHETEPPAPEVRNWDSRFSLNSSFRSSEGSLNGGNGDNFDESQYMRSLFAQFTDEQILESWNSYVQYTGNAYTIEQIVSLRTIYGANQTVLPGSGAVQNSPTTAQTDSPVYL